jgi:uncharacterized protein (UPF0264 family)
LNDRQPRRSGLLVSVRSAAEAEAALAGGADLIDVKEPSGGSLGRADDSVIAAVVQVVAGRKPVSAAMGEVRDFVPASGPEVRYRKWGFAGCGRHPEPFRKRIAVTSPAKQVVLAAYADWERSDAPPPEALRELACRWQCGAFLLDTFVKDGSTLLDWMSYRELQLLCESCLAGGLRVALAGSLGHHEIAALAQLRPDWFAVRGAACQDGKRGGAIDEQRVGQLAELIRTSLPARVTGS